MAKLRRWRRARRSLHAHLREETSRLVTRPAIVFAPHPDDETLGCGGATILKREAGTAVACVFMTDGVASHRRYFDEKKLRHLRKKEALEAALVLGLASSDLHFLDLPDGKLGRFHAEAATKALVLLDQLRPEDIFVPCADDGHLDHEACHHIVVDAVRKADLAVRICEYPIWLWNQWPWVSMPMRCNRRTVKALGRMGQVGVGVTLWKKFQLGVFIGDVLPRKRNALARYRSQMTPLKPGVGWPTLPEVSGGEFLECFFQDYEIFRCRQIPATNGGPGGV